MIQTQFRAQRTETRTTQHLDRLAGHLWSQLLFSRATPEDSMDAQIHAFIRSVQALQSARQTLVNLIESSIDAMVSVDASGAARGPLVQECRAAVAEHVPAWSFVLTDDVPWEDFGLDQREFFESLRDRLRQQIAHMGASYQAHLDGLADANILGVLNWHPTNPKVCEYHYYRALLSQHEIDRKTEATQRKDEHHADNRWEIIETKTTVRTNEKTLKYVRFYHRLYKSRADRWPAHGVPKPTYIHAMIESVPTWLHSHLGVVSGDMFPERRTEHVQWKKRFDESDVERRVIDSGRLYSPALVFGDVVLAGWSDGDL